MPSNQLSILLVEDEKDAAERMSLLLTKIDTGKFRGKQSARPVVTVARNQIEADEAIDVKAAPEGFDLILLDLKYPGRNGRTDEQTFEGMKWLPALRKLQPRSAIAIQTAYPYGDQMKSAVTALRDHQADEFIPKSTNWSSTEARLAAAWDKARLQRWGTFLHDGYTEFLHSRIFRAVAEDTRDEVCRRTPRFRNLASQLENSGCADASKSIQGEYGALIDEILKITNPVDDGVENRLDEVDASLLLDGLQLFHSKPDNDTIRIMVNKAEGRVRTHDRDLRTALHELVENAVEAHEDELEAAGNQMGEITLSSRPVIMPRAGIEITISDNGPGFMEEVLRNPFRRGFSSRNKKEKPFRGMGLYVAQRCVNRIFGGIELSNKPLPGRGARVVLFIPDLSELISKT